MTGVQTCALPICLYAAFALLSFLFVSRFIPETNGMSLEEANTLLPPKDSAKAGAAASQKGSAKAGAAASQKGSAKAGTAASQKDSARG